MNKILKSAKKNLSLIGFDTHSFLSFFKGLPYFLRTRKVIKKQLKEKNDFQFKLYPNFEDRFSSGGTMKGHYFNQDLYVARKIYQNNPVKHLDIGSRVDGFVAHVAVFREIEIIDIRPIESKVANIVTLQADLLKLPENYHHYCDSVSSLHAIEHIGLGRYGDPIDIDGHIKAIATIYDILKNNGKFYFSVPIGAQRIDFNSHRVFDVKYLLGLFEGKFKVNSFAYVNDAGDLNESVSLTPENINKNFNCHYGCGIFELTKV